MTSRDPVSIGLFGTCGNSKWRDSFTWLDADMLQRVEVFNPMKADWKPEDALIEAQKLKTVDVAVFAITDETFGVASLSEIFVALLHRAYSGTVIVYVSPTLKQELKNLSPIAYKDSTNARAIIRAHLDQLKMTHHQLKVVNSLDELSVMTKKQVVGLLIDRDSVPPYITEEVPLPIQP